MLPDPLTLRIFEASEGNEELSTALSNARNTVGDKYVEALLDLFPERGNALWSLFLSQQQEWDKRLGHLQCPLSFDGFIRAYTKVLPELRRKH